jgi:hypothetical protein
MPKIKILSSYLIKSFNTPPILNSEEQEIYFNMDNLTKEINNIRLDINKAVFILSVSYFRQSRRFFPVGDYHQKDIEFVASYYSLKLGKTALETLQDNRSVYRYRESILNHFGIKPFELFVI